MRKKKERKKMWLIDIRKYDRIFLKKNVINVEIIKLMEIYSDFWDTLILMKLLYSLLELSKNSIIRWKFRSPLSIVVVWHQITKFNFFKRNLINFLQFGAIKPKELNQIKKI